MNEFQNRIDEYVDTLDLPQFPEFSGLNSTQRGFMKQVVMLCFLSRILRMFAVFD